MALREPSTPGLYLAPEELVLLAGCVNETLEAVEDWEFSSRLGVERAVAVDLRRQLGGLISRLPER